MYEDKKQKYFNSVRYDIISQIPQMQGCHLLEVGAGSGATLVEIKQRGLAESVTGMDIFSIPDSLQTHPSIDNFIIADIESHDFPHLTNTFDVILCADVLEHLKDPWASVRKLKGMLKQNGVIIASIPNFRELMTIKKIFLNGNFEYATEGILDKTHLRFFCRKNMIELFEQAQLEIQKIVPNFNLVPGFSKRRLINQLSFGLFSDLLSFQYIIKVRKQ